MSDGDDTSDKPVSASADDLKGWFGRYGWSYEAIDDITFRTGFRGKNASFVALVRITDFWVVFSINPLVKAPTAGFGEAGLRALAMANHQANLAKFGVDDEGDAFINVELPTEGFTWAHFQAAIGALAEFADGLIVPLLQARAIDERQA
jgi:hypothetical protein